MPVLIDFPGQTGSRWACPAFYIYRVPTSFCIEKMEHG
jgi:hypothetical protein